MMREYTTGNRIVDASAEISITGNITPQAWYKTIVKETGKPHLAAIVILSDIVYWYRPTELRDESTGQIIAIRKKFKADLLQRSYQQIAEQFGLSKKEATNAIIFLEKLGVIKRVFRTINLNGLVVNNVLYIELIVEKLKELTYPHCYDAPIPSMGDRGEDIVEEIVEGQCFTVNNSEMAVIGEGAVSPKRERVSPKKEIPATPQNSRCHFSEGTALSGNRQTNTDIKDLAHIQITVTTLDDNKALTYEKASIPSKRVEAIKKLQSAGYDVSIRLSPLIEDFMDFDSLNSLGINRCVVEFLRVNSWIKSWLHDVDFSGYRLKQGGYCHLPLEKKMEIIKKIRIPEITVCEDVTEHYEYWRDNFNPNKDDCCNLRLHNG